MKTIRKIRYALAAALSATSALLIPLAFIYSSTLAGMLDSLLHLKIDPRFSGGEEIAYFYDPVGDSFDEANFNGQTGSGCEEGVLDLVRYSVHRPVINAPWSRLRDYWQLAAVFYRVSVPEKRKRENRFCRPILSILIDSDCKDSGSALPFSHLSNDSKLKRSEKPSAPSRNPGNSSGQDSLSSVEIALSVDVYGQTGSAVTADGRNLPLQVFLIEKTNTIYIRIPLTGPHLRSILDDRPTRHYVLLSTDDSTESPAEKAERSFRSINYRIVDFMTPDPPHQMNRLNQRKSQSSVAAPFRFQALRTDESSNAPVNPQLLEKCRRMAESEKVEEKRKKSLRLKKMRENRIDEIELAVAGFEAGEYAQSEGILIDILSRDPKNALALACLGSITAMKAGRTGIPLEAVNLVNEAFRLLDRAVLLSKGTGEETSARFHRGEVSLAVPENVFHKNESGAEDFLRAAELLEKRKPSPKEALAEAYLKAARCLENSGNRERSEIFFLKAISAGRLSAQNRLELIKRGFIR